MDPKQFKVCISEFKILLIRNIFYDYEMAVAARSFHCFRHHRGLAWRGVEKGWGMGWLRQIGYNWDKFKRSSPSLK